MNVNLFFTNSNDKTVNYVDELLITDTLSVIEIRGFHCLDGLNKIYPGFLLIPLNLATFTS